MSEIHGTLNNLLEQFSVKYPIIGYSISFMIMGISLVLPNFWDWVGGLEIPKIVMQGSQLIVLFGGFGITILTFVLNRRNKKK